MITESEIERRNFENKLTDLVAYLPEGRNNPVKAHELAEHIGVDKRTLSAYVSYLIKHKGVPVGSSRRAPSGYYIMTDETDRLATLAPLEAQATEELKRVNSLRHINLDTWRYEFELNRKELNKQWTYQLLTPTLIGKQLQPLTC